MDAMTANPLLRRRNSIATTAVAHTKSLHAATPPSSSLSYSSPSFSTVDFELISIKPLSYTSLKDLLPSTAVLSPTAAACDISIRNRLLKQAAWAYLQPLSTSPDSIGLHFLRRLWLRLSGDFTAFLQFIDRHIVRAITGVFDRLIRLIRVRSFC